jgi:hypothetical protein
MQLYLLERGHSYTETFQIHLQLVRIAQRNGIKNISFLNGHLVQFVLVELLAPMCPTIEVCCFVSDPQGKKDQILSYIAAHCSECISYVAMLNYLTIPRLNRLPFNMPARALREGHLANFRFIIPIASRIAPPPGFSGSNGCIARSNLPAVESSAESSASSDSVEISRSAAAVVSKLFRFAVFSSLSARFPFLNGHNDRAAI